MKKIILFLMALLLPLHAMALTSADLMPGADDATMQVFGYIFGNIGGIFPGAPDSTLIGDMFQVFNSAMMIVGGVLIGYIVLSGTLKTAHEGEVLGRAWSSIFIPIRASMAIGMVLPGPAGYCLAQVLVMYCTITGVGMANKVWDIAEQRILFGHSEVSFASDGSKIIDGALSGFTCQKAYFLEATGDQALTDSLKSDPTITGGSTSGRVYDWGMCGKLSIPYAPSSNMAVNTIYQAKIALLEGTVLPQLKILGDKIAKGLNTPDDSIKYGAIKKSFNDQVSSIAASTFKIAAAGNTGLAGGSGNVDGSTYGLSNKYGWILAGSTYLKMAKSYQETAAKASSNTISSGPKYDELGMYGVGVSQKMKSYTAFTGKAVDDAKALQISQGASKTSYDASNIEDDIKSSLNEGTYPTINSLFKPMGMAIKSGISDDPGGLMAVNNASSMSADGMGNPMLQLVSFGSKMADITIVAYGVVNVGMSILVGAGSGWVEQLGTLGTVNIGAGIGTFWAGVSPLFNMLCLTLISAGLSMSVYLPMMPTIIWIMAVCGYLVLVFESMLAAPIWAVMHASPDGHEMSGQGSQGYMIIMGVILRPTLMIFGLVGAMIMVNVMIFLMKMMFTYTSGMIDIISSVGPLAYIVLFCLYVWLSIKIVHRSLEMITEIPSGIMRWIGGGHDPLDAGTAQQGNSFVGAVMNKGEGGSQAAGAAMSGKKSQEASIKAAAIEKAELKAERTAESAQLISAVNNLSGASPVVSEKKSD